MDFYRLKISQFCCYAILVGRINNNNEIYFFSLTFPCGCVVWYGYDLLF